MANNPNHKKNLKNFTKNDPRINKKGRPKLPDLREVMADLLGDEQNGKTALWAIVVKLRQMAIMGNIKAAEVLLGRGYGLPKQSLEHTGKDGEKLFPSWLSNKPDGSSV